MVTSWNYCYYTEGLSNSIKYTATFAVWRNDSTSSNLVMVTGSSKIVVLRPRSTIATIYCEVINLDDTDEDFTIMEGDYVGVFLPRSNSIPMLGEDSDFSLLQVNITTIMEINSLQYTNLMSREWALHLFANMGRFLVIMSMILSTSRYSSFYHEIYFLVDVVND